MHVCSAEREKSSSAAFMCQLTSFVTPQLSSIVRTAAVARVNTDLKKQILQARLAKKMTQAQLAQV
jgi:hypothetical protein